MFVHILTASGVLCSLAAVLAVSEGNITTAFWWLALALFIDAIDGPMARLVNVKARLPRFSGERLDLLVDYLNYVMIPAFVLVKVPLVAGYGGMVGASLILLSSLYHFADLSSKTTDGYFIGFPAVWNLVVFYLLAFDVSGWPALMLICFFAVLTFVPLKWVHPFRVQNMRWLTAGLVVIWGAASLSILLDDFQAGLPEKAVLMVTLVYIGAVSLHKSFRQPVR